MTKFNSAFDIQGSGAYGINRIKILKGMEKAVLAGMKGDTFQCNEFKYGNFEQYVPWKTEFWSLIDTTNNLIKAVADVIDAKPGIEKEISDSKIIS